MKKTPNVRYVDMAIYVDENIHKPDHDVKKVFDYLTMLAYMLAVKRRFFNWEWYYDRFSEYLARITYMRIIKADKPQYKYKKLDDEDCKIDNVLIDKLVIEKYPNSVKRNNIWFIPYGEPLKEGDKGWLSPIKSCLNYMKQVLYVKKCQFVAEEFDWRSTEDNFETVKDFAYKSILDSNNDLLACEISTYFTTIDRIVKEEVAKSFYGNDKVLSWKLYTSCLLSLLRNLTPSNKNKNKLQMAIERNSYTDDLMTDIMYEESKDAPVVYDLDKKYLDYVAFLLKKVKQRIVVDIQELSNEYRLSDEMVEDILMSSLSGGDDDD